MTARELSIMLTDLGMRRNLVPTHSQMIIDNIEITDSYIVVNNIIHLFLYNKPNNHQILKLTMIMKEHNIEVI